MSNRSRVLISAHGVRRLRDGHLWVYQSDVIDAAGALPGDEVRVVDGSGRFYGRAFFSSESQIRLRIVSGADRDLDTAFFDERIARALALREQLFAGETTYRLVHGEADGVPGLVVDRYDDVLVVQALNQATDRRLSLFTELLSARLAPRAIVERNDVRVRELEGLPQRRGVIAGTLSPTTLQLTLAGLALEVDPLSGQKTGTFLDQRENQLRAAELVQSADRCLDVFTHVGGFALHLARAGGRVDAVEISADALRHAERNAALNQLDVSWIEANAFDWLKAQSQDGPRYRVIVLDPPAFARSKSAVKGAERGYKEINLRAMKLLEAGGFLVSCSCSYNVSEERLLELVGSAASDAKTRLQLIEKRNASRDHPALLGVAETSYLKCLIFRKLD
ncbi:MAG: class I SAM-dependent rRNA methyltransferase [Myxococcales bacterium]|nr:class I SAM-dependent rRNA methyltransferase [Myxococcales bacterium]